MWNFKNFKDETILVVSISIFLILKISENINVNIGVIFSLTMKP